MAACEHRWIDVTTLEDRGERRMCALCGWEQRRDCGGEWETSKIVTKDYSLWIESQSTDSCHR